MIIKSRVERVSKEFDLSHILNKKIWQINDEDKCKIVLSRLQIRDAKYYFIDDVFSGKFGIQFSKLLQKVAEMAIKYKKLGKNVMFFTRNKEFAEKIADKVMVVANHEMREFEYKEKLLSSPKNVYSVIAFYGQENIMTCDISGKNLVDRMGHLSNKYIDFNLPSKSVYLYIPNDAIKKGTENRLQVRRVTRLENGFFRHILRNGMIVDLEGKHQEVEFDFDLNRCMLFDIQTGLRVR